MPRKAKEKSEEIEEKVVKKAATKKKTVASKKQATTKKTAVKSTTSKTSKTTTKKKAQSKSTASKKVSTTKKKSIEVLEYYDLPYRYNQTVVKILAQTPNTLFVYWDISDSDKENYIKQYDEYFFNNTKPVLIVNNITKNYSYEVDINDFANSWYLHIDDSNCDYQIELGRRPINNYINIPNDYMYIAKSNNIDVPNDHILFDELSHVVYFKNVKNNNIINKNIVNFTFLEKIGKLNSLKDFYKKMYPEEDINFDKLNLTNPSSSNPTSSFK